MQIALKAGLAAATLVLAGQSMAQIVLYEGRDFRGRAISVDRPVRNLERMNFDDKTRSVVVERGRWEVCEEPRFQGRCAVLRRGHYDSLRDAGVNWRIASVRPAEGRRRYDAEPAVSTAPVYQYRQRANERLTEVPVNWSRAVMGPPDQRCWVERQAVPVQAQSSNIGGAVVGAVIGGILGHQVGGGSGRDAATAAGVVAGAAIGNNVGGGSANTSVATQDVQRCTSVSGAPAYYEVSYNFRGAEHRVQMNTPPGNTILVNVRGEPRT